jgi:large subunit ribosomal protein L6
MSRVGRMPVPVPSGVEVKLDGNLFSAKGRLGTMNVDVPQGMTVDIQGSEITVTRRSDSKPHRSLHGLTRSLVNSAIVGVHEGFSKKLEIIGVGYRAELKGKSLIMHLGFSHPITFEPLDGIEFEVPDNTHVVVKGRDKQAVGQVASEIRGKRPPEPYKGNGVKYDGEHIRRKAGKTAASLGAF